MAESDSVAIGPDDPGGRMALADPHCTFFNVICSPSPSMTAADELTREQFHLSLPEQGWGRGRIVVRISILLLPQRAAAHHEM